MLQGSPVYILNPILIALFHREVKRKNDQELPDAKKQKLFSNDVGEEESEGDGGM